MVKYWDRLKPEMDAEGMDITKFAERMGISFQAVAKVRDGGSFGTKNNIKAARLFGLNSDWLASGKGPKKAVEQDPSNVGTVSARKTVPLISWIKAGSWGDVQDEFQPGQADEWVDSYENGTGANAFALRVTGDSMTSPYPGDLSFPDGTIIIVDPERSSNAGDFVVAKDVGTQTATFKRLAYDAGRWYLKPLNPTYPSIEIDDPSIRVIGRVCEFRTGGKL